MPHSPGGTQASLEGAESGSGAARCHPGRGHGDGIWGGDMQCGAEGGERKG